jgi:hypothetical protein
MTFTTLLSTDISLPEETWFPAQVRKHGRALEITADDSVSSAAKAGPMPSGTSFDAWLTRAAGSAKAGPTTNDAQ